ncbi:multiple epidermal growth factor-like domains protein 10, partial [Gigantopelta aegis]|uniref:multiple epidermal growth factor-like domains protein 10 n=1 Tax=Gigantopelta aegis TaxID=1735272 RepID=UPI001B88DA73
MTCDDTARYITLYRDAGDSAMNFCEVQVFKCDSDHYGPLCEKPCSSRHCDESRGKSSCNKTTGRCDNGCRAGWKELDCTKECSEFTYGVRCANNCRQRNCFGNSDCDHVTGKCDHGCDRGYQSEDCTTMCPSGRYGYNCNMSCEERKCDRNSVCDRYNGTCHSGCLKGWELPDCITKCQHNTFGPNCLFNCTERHCKEDNSICDVEDECDAGQYGPECNSSCSARHCKANDGSCDHLTGLCSGPCEAGWQGDDCTL